MPLKQFLLCPFCWYRCLCDDTVNGSVSSEMAFLSCRIVSQPHQFPDLACCMNGCVSTVEEAGSLKLRTDPICETKIVVLIFHIKRNLTDLHRFLLKQRYLLKI